MGTLWLELEKRDAAVVLEPFGIGSKYLGDSWSVWSTARRIVYQRTSI